MERESECLELGVQATGQMANGQGVGLCAGADLLVCNLLDVKCFWDIQLDGS